MFMCTLERGDVLLEQNIVCGHYATSSNDNILQIQITYLSDVSIEFEIDNLYVKLSRSISVVNRK